ncbi:MAG: hypothetical protein IH597_01615 [Bacteroidales bacterium]|nr:hypothetical protein [Bacteroidales bacterium]
MNKEKEIFQRDDLRTGGFYELCIQVCPSIDNKPIELYINYIWTLDNVKGPFDKDFNKTEIDINNFEHQGLITLDNSLIPFKTFNIREEEPIEAGFNWFDISFYTAAIEYVFGEEYKTWTEKPKCPPQIERFFDSLIKQLFKIYKFKLAIIDFEVSGQYYLDDLKKPIENIFYPKFFVGTENYDLIAEENKKSVTFI